VYQLQLVLMAAAVYLPARSGVDPLALEKRLPRAAGEGSQVPNSGSKRLPVAKAAGEQALEPEGLMSLRWFQGLGHSCQCFRPSWTALTRDASPVAY
jgi:hypothetical protein